jgi:hypothetical protein
MKSCGEKEVKLHLFLTLELLVDEFLASLPGSFTSGKELTLLTAQQEAGWVSELV